MNENFKTTFKNLLPNYSRHTKISNYIDMPMLKYFTNAVIASKQVYIFLRYNYLQQKMLFNILP